jgi:alpha-beta hydrolase superfamily lysophospholipase
VLIPGSGPADRDETFRQAKPFRDIAYGLSHHGVASLRFDKRTHAHPEALDATHLTVEEELLADAVDAVQQMATRPEVDPRRIFIVGHSLGGLLAPEIAERARGVAGLVLLSAPGRPLGEVMIEQLRSHGVTAADLAPLEAKVHALSTLPATEMLMGMPVHYFQDLQRRDEMATAVRLGLPVLYLRGELDQNVLAIDQANWARALTDKVPFAEATLPGLNHLFLPAPPKQAMRTRIPEEVIARIAAFALR